MIPSAILTRLVASIVYELSFCCIAEDLSLVSLEEVVCVCVSVGGLGRVGEVCVARQEVKSSTQSGRETEGRNRGFRMSSALGVWAMLCFCAGFARMIRTL